MTKFDTPHAREGAREGPIVEALRESEQRHRALFEQSPAAALVYDGMLHVTGANAACTALLAGATGNEILGDALAEHFDARMLTTFRAALEGSGMECEGAWSSKRSRRALWLRVRVSPLRSAEGRVTGAVAIFDDWTDRRRLEQLREAHTMEAVGRLAGSIAHDFNNLLTAIRSTDELALESLPPDSAVREDLLDIKQAADRAVDLTRRLLAFSRGRLLELEPIDPCDVLRDVEQALRRLVGNGITLRTSIQAEIGKVRADRAQLENALVSVVDNAREAMPHGGTLTIDLHRARIGDADAVAIAVSDTGHGMDESTRKRIFDPFFTTKSNAYGSGLGLPVAQGIVAQLGGRIEVKSAPGKGSTFTILLPR